MLHWYSPNPEPEALLLQKTIERSVPLGLDHVQHRKPARENPSAQFEISNMAGGGNGAPAPGKGPVKHIPAWRYVHGLE